MKNPFLTVTILFLGLGISQAQSSTNNRVSPMDSVQQTVNGLDVKIVYSRPFLKGREFGKDIVPFGKLWRTGANEATTFEINKDVHVNGKNLPAGKYSLYTIPDKTETAVIFNKEWNQWGTKYDESQDMLRIIVPTENSEESIEQFTIEVDEDGDVDFEWGTVEFGFKLEDI